MDQSFDPGAGHGAYAVRDITERVPRCVGNFAALKQPALP